MSASELVYTSSTNRRSDRSAGTELAAGGLTLVLDHQNNCVLLGGYVLPVMWLDEGDFGTDYVARFKVDCSNPKVPGHHLIFTVDIYHGRAEILKDQQWYIDGDRPAYYGGDVREFSSLKPFLRYMQDQVVAAHQAAQPESLAQD